MKLIDRLTDEQVVKVVRKAASGFLANKIEGVTAHETSDSRGEEALSVTIILKPNSTRTIEDDRVLDTLVAIQTALWKRGEERLAIVHYEEAGQEEEPDPDVQAA